jgi:hypothetical protein
MARKAITNPNLLKAQKDHSWALIDKIGMPKGQVVRLLDEAGVKQDLIDQIATRCVPYGHTQKQDD